MRNLPTLRTAALIALAFAWGALAQGGQGMSSSLPTALRSTVPARCQELQAASLRFRSELDESGALQGARRDEASSLLYAFNREALELNLVNPSPGAYFMELGLCIAQSDHPRREELERHALEIAWMDAADLPASWRPGSPAAKNDPRAPDSGAPDSHETEQALRMYRLAQGWLVLSEFVLGKAQPEAARAVLGGWRSAMARRRPPTTEALEAGAYRIALSAVLARRP